MAKPALIDLNTDELCHYPFILHFDRRGGFCNNLDNVSPMISDLSELLYVTNKIRDGNVKVFSMVTRFNESYSLLFIYWIMKLFHVIVNMA